MENNRPKVGLSVMLTNDQGEILLLKRKGAHGAGTWCLPGGHVEWMEKFEETAKRECLEEIGVTITKPILIGVTNDRMESENKHYITIFMTASIRSGRPSILEPNRAEEIGWYSLNNFPQPIFIPLSNFLISNQYHFLQKT